MSSNYPYRGQKEDLYEGGQRNPAFANWPHQVQENGVSGATIMTIELTPTFGSLALAEISDRLAIRFDGKDIIRVLLYN